MYSKPQIKQIDDTLNNIINEIKQESRSELDEIEIEICKYIIKNTTYSVDNLLNQNVASALYFHKSQCSGIAKSVKYIMDRLGIWCIVVFGKASEAHNIHRLPHAWNVVRINGNYYHLDVTNMLNFKNIGDIRALPFFNYSDNKLMATHEWDRLSVPKCNDERYASAGENYNSTNHNITENVGENSENIPVISSVKTLTGLLKKASNGKIKFKYNSIKSLNCQQLLIMDAVQDYCKENKIIGSIQVSYVRDFWLVEIIVS